MINSHNDPWRREKSALPNDPIHSFPAFDLLEHPAEVKLRVRGTTPPQLFANAARGMMVYLFGEEIVKARPQRWERIEIRSRDREALLVDWLSELLYRAASQHHAFADFRISEINECGLVSMAGIVPGEPVDDIKAVTHHELSIIEREGAFEATVVFDV
jgi:SHS2 domain-containing protein